MREEIQRIAESIPFEDCARCVHRKMLMELVEAGFGCLHEVDAFYPGKTGIRKGRIDILAFRDGKRIGIEIDNQAPREKSVLKLLEMDLDYRFIVLRRKRFQIGQIRGIDGVFYTQQPRGLGRGVSGNHESSIKVIR